MKLFIQPDEIVQGDLCRRPALPQAQLETYVKGILQEVKEGGDRVLLQLAEKHDGVKLDELRVSKQEISIAIDQVSDELKNAIRLAAANIDRFHSAQLVEEPEMEIMPGIRCLRRNVAIESVGLYIPGGSAPLFSTILMLAIPARIAGCSNIVLCTPCDKNGNINATVLFVADMLGITSIFKTGGAQAIAAMTYGTESIPRVNKVFGPGNQYVTKAKTLVQAEGIAIDIPAGPSELLIIADQYADADFVAADLLSQAEHGADSQVVLLSDSPALIQKVQQKLEQMLQQIPRQQQAKQAIKNSFCILFDTPAECIAFSNRYAPEHLIVATADAEQLMDTIRSAGSVFLGKYSCESAGDYASGPNHTLPTAGYAAAYSGVSVDSFLKKITFQTITSEGLQLIGPAIEIMAEAEQLEAHKNAVSIRLKKINTES